MDVSPPKIYYPALSRLSKLYRDFHAITREIGSRENLNIPQLCNHYDALLLAMRRP